VRTRATGATPTLADIAARPELVLELAPEIARCLLVQLAALQAALLVRAVSRGRQDEAGDTLLTVTEASARLSLGEDWLYRNARKLPFTVRVGRQVRFSARRLEAYITAHANGHSRTL
jgi:excisionase family DNA binding protein